MFPFVSEDEIPPDNPHVDAGVHPSSQYYPSINPQAAEPESTISPGGPAVTGLDAPSSDDLGAFTGITYVEAANQVHSGLTAAETDWYNVGSGEFGVGLEILSAAADPFAYIGGQLLSWMLEHVEPLRSALDGLAGNPDIIEAYAKSWNDISQEMSSIAADFNAYVHAGASTFVGMTGDAYRARASDIKNLIDAASVSASALERLSMAVAKVIAGVRTAIRDIATGLAGGLVADAALSLAVGPGTATAAADAMRRIAKTLAESSKYLRWLAHDVTPYLITEFMALRDIADGIYNGFSEIQKA